MKTIAFDIETMVDESLYQLFAPPIDVKTGNLKDPAKIAEKQAEAEQKQRSMAALNPHLSRVLSIHFAEIDHRSSEPIVESFFTLPPNGNDATLQSREADALRSMWNKLAGADRLITFNGASFDVPFIMRRSLLCGVTPSIAIETNKYRVIDGKSNHIDVRRVLAESFPGSGIADFVPGDLNYYALLLLGDTTPDELAPEELRSLWAEGNLERIRRYGERDALRTLQMYNRLDGFYFN